VFIGGFFMLVKIFVLGRPGSGKSTAVRHFVMLAQRRNYPVVCVKDYDILYRMFQEDRSYKQFRPADYGGFDVLDHTAFDTALNYLEQDILTFPSSEEKKIMTIEFARSNYHTALKLFHSETLRDAYVLFVDADLKNCIDRIHKRVKSPFEVDHHFVSDYIMRSYYSEENWMYVSSLLKKEYPFLKEVVPMCNMGSASHLRSGVSKFAEMIFQKEFVEGTLVSKQETKEGILVGHDNKRVIVM
jgi:dephospho-CoA kinase